MPKASSAGRDDIIAYLLIIQYIFLFSCANNLLFEVTDPKAEMPALTNEKE